MESRHFGRGLLSTELEESGELAVRVVVHRLFYWRA